MEIIQFKCLKYVCNSQIASPALKRVNIYMFKACVLPLGGLDISCYSNIGFFWYYCH